jgi:hypothetical protein
LTLKLAQLTPGAPKAAGRGPFFAANRTSTFQRAS